MKRSQALQLLRKHRKELYERYHVTTLFLFGSVARDDALPDSDVDLLVEFGEPVGLFQFIELQQRLEKVLGYKVDLGTPRSLKPYLKEEILREAIRVTQNLVKSHHSILTCAKNIRDFSAGMTLDTFLADPRTTRAVAFEFTTIGEATRVIPSEVQERYSDIPWGKMQSIRNVLVHEYFRLDEEILWRAIQEDIPPLIIALEKIIESKKKASV